MPGDETNKITVKCEHCGQEYEAEESNIGETAECTTCGKEFLIKAEKTPSPPAGFANPKTPSPKQSAPAKTATATVISGPWQARPIFISSTFKDMQAERDYLRSHVFPRLEEELRKRRHQFEPIDLRMGIESGDASTEEARELLVLKVCLDEIKRSRPFLLVLLGDRYGWTPPEERMVTAAREAGFQGDVCGRSVTALEIEYGILKESPDQTRRSFFYFRDPLPYDKVPNDVAAVYDDAHSPDPEVRAGHDRLVALKNRLKEDPELKPRVHSYSATWDASAKRVTGLEAFGEMVFQNIWKELEEETRVFASQTPPTWEEQERVALIEFVENRVRNFTGREELLGQLKKLACAPTDSPITAPLVTSSSPWGACLIGAPGSGKSAVFAELLQMLTADGSALILANAAGATSRGASVDSMLRRWIQELSDFLKIDDPLPEKASPDDVDNTFYSLLHRAARQRRVVVILDALDQFEESPRSKYMTWFRPKQWPTNARIIATSLPDPRAGKLTECDGVGNLELSPLSTTDAEQIARKVWARYHQPFDAAVLRVLTDKKVGDAAVFGNPLWLTLALEQLSLLDADDFARVEREFTGSPSERLRALKLDIAGKMPADVEGVYGWLLDWTEKAFGVAHARSFAVAIALSRFGWRESDLLSLVPRLAPLLFPGATIPAFDDLKLAVLRRGFRAHLARRGAAGQLDFFHAQMRRTLFARILGDTGLTKQLHRAIADHLETLPSDDHLRATELMVHLIEGDDAPRAARIYADLSVPLGTPSSGATQALARHIVLGAAQRPNPNVPWIIALLTQPGLASQQIANLANRFVFDLNYAIENLSDLPTRQALFEASRQSQQRLALSDPSNAGWQRALSVSQEKIGEVLQAQGDLAGALNAYREYQTGMQRLALSDPSNAGLQRDLSVSQAMIGDVLRAQGDLAGALKAYRETMRVQERLALSDPSNAGWQRDLSVSQEKIGEVLQAQGDLAGALKAYRETMRVRELLSKSDPSNANWQRDLSVSQAMIGDVLRAQGDLAGALKAYRESMKVRELLSKSDPSNAGWQRDLSSAHCFVGIVLEAQGDLAGALKAYREYQSGMQRLALSDPSNAGWQRALSVSQEKIGEVLQAQGDLAGALKAYRESMRVQERLALSDPSNAGWQRDLSVSQAMIGGVLQAQGDLAGALKAYRETMRVQERLALSDPSNADRQLDLSVSLNKIGDVLLAQGNLPGALKAYREYQSGMQRLALSDPSNAGCQRDLAVSQDRIGDVLRAQGDLAGALKAYRESMKVRELLSKSDPSNAGWQRDLFVSYWKMADMAEKNGTGDAREWWGKSYDQLSGMKQRGIMLATDEQYLTTLRQKAGK